MCGCDTPVELGLGIPLILGVLLNGFGAESVIRREPHALGQCAACKYSLLGLPVDAPCPECGEKEPNLAYCADFAVHYSARPVLGGTLVACAGVVAGELATRFWVYHLLANGPRMVHRGPMLDFRETVIREGAFATLLAAALLGSACRRAPLLAPLLAISLSVAGAAVSTVLLPTPVAADSLHVAGRIGAVAGCCAGVGLLLGGLIGRWKQRTALRAAKVPRVYTLILQIMFLAVLLLRALPGE